MTNVQNIDTIDVCQRYFHTDDVPIRKYAVIFKVESNITMNRVISKKDVICFILERYANRNKSSSLSISRDTIRIDLIRDFMGEKIFHEENEKYNG